MHMDEVVGGRLDIDGDDGVADAGRASPGVPLRVRRR